MEGDPSLAGEAADVTDRDARSSARSSLDTRVRIASSCTFIGTRLAALGFVIAAAWAVLSVLRLTLVVERASDIAAEPGSHRSAVTDAALNGDGAFVAASLIVGASLAGLAITWRRSGAIGWPATALVGRAGPALLVVTPALEGT